MTILALGVFVAVLLVEVGIYYVALRRLEGRIAARQEALDALDQERRSALYKQQKASERTVQRSDKAVRRLADQSRQLHEDSRLLHERVDRFFADPDVKRLMRQEATDG